MNNEIKHTLSSTFVFPLLGIDRGLFNCKVNDGFGRRILSNRFINAYLDNLNFPHFQHYKVHVLLPNYQDKDFITFNDTLDSLSIFWDEYDYKPAKKKTLSKNCGYIVKIFEIPKEFQEDYDLIFEGKYSKISKAGKLRILNHCYGKMSLVNILPKIFDKDDTIRQAWETKLSYKNSTVNLQGQEVWTKIKVPEETLNDDIIENLMSSKKINPLEN